MRCAYHFIALRPRILPVGDPVVMIIDDWVEALGWPAKLLWVALRTTLGPLVQVVDIAVMSGA